MKTLIKKSVIVAIAIGGLLALTVPEPIAQAAPVYFEFNGTQTGGGATVQALLGINSSLVAPNGAFNQSSLNLSLFVQYNGTFTASGSALPASMSGQFNGTANVFSSLFVNDSLTTFTPSFSGTNNFQFYGLNGESWSMATAGFPPIGTTQTVGTGTWRPVAPVPLPGAAILFGSGLAGLFLRRARKVLS